MNDRPNREQAFAHASGATTVGGVARDEEQRGETSTGDTPSDRSTQERQRGGGLGNDREGDRSADQVSAHGEGAGHGNHTDHAAMFRERFWWSLVLTVPIVVFSPMVQDWVGVHTPSFTGEGLIGPVLGSIVFWWAGWPFLVGGYSEARERQPGMMLLIAMAITVAYGSSLATWIGWIDLEFWWELAALISIMLLGHWLEMRAIGQARGALGALAELLPDEAERLTADGVEVVPVAALQPGDLVLVRAGARVPADGTVAEGSAEVDESMITGESRPVAKGPSDSVVAGTVATDSAIRIRVDAVGDATALAGIQRLVTEAAASHSNAQALADRAAGWLFYVAAGSGVLTFIVWLALGRTDDAITRTVTVLVIACPHALGLAIPLVISISTAISARAGILVKDRLALERMRQADVVLFDKTGTLTMGQHQVVGAVAADPATTDDKVLRLAASAESDSEHPLARAIVAAAHANGPVQGATEFRSRAGRGVQASVDGSTIAVGGPTLLRESGVVEPAAISDTTSSWSARGAAVLHVLRDNEVIGAIGLEDTPRPESRETIEELHQRGVQVVMLTGDARAVAEAVAADLGVDEVFAEVLPEDKDHVVAELQARGHTVAMVGDGVNDAPALARADIGLAIGAGTDVAIESAGVVLASSDPRAVLGVITLSQASYRKMLQNLGWAAGYNLVAIPLAAGVLAWAGFVLPPAVGAVLMSLSTVVVALNAQLLRQLHLRRDRPPSTTTAQPALARA